MSRFAWPAFAILFLTWATLPLLVAPNISLDAAEGLLWGRHWLLGYEKHPPLQAWMLEAARLIFGPGPAAHVWMSSLCAVVCSWAVWRAARQIADERTAFWSAIGLQAVYFHNYTLPEFNPNVLQLPFFALAGLFAVHALRAGRARDWLALGAVLGTGMYAKYSVSLIALSIALFFIADRDARARLASPWPWAGAGLAAMIFAPHLAWLAAADARSVGYVLDRAQIAPDLAGRVLNIAEFAITLLLIGAPLLFGLIAGRSRPAAPREAPWSSAERLALCLALGPLAITLLMGLLAGFRIKSAWLAPLWCYTPLALMLVLRIDTGARAFRRSAAVILFMACLAPAAYFGVNAGRPYLAGKPMRIHFPGRDLAEAMDAAWRAEFQTPLRMVIGPTLEAGSAAHYSAFEPVVRVNDDVIASPWASEALAREAGAVIIWDADREGDGIPAETRRRHPRARLLAVLELRHQTGAELPPARIGLAVIPPATPPGPRPQ